MRLKYATNVRVVRLPCTGKVDVRVLLETFLGGADGILVVGCHEGDCHFQVGNVKARKRVGRTQEFLRAAGVDPERLEMAHVASSEGARFGQLADAFTDKIRALGPSEARGGAARAARETPEEAAEPGAPSPERAEVVR